MKSPYHQLAHLVASILQNGHVNPKVLGQHARTCRIEDTHPSRIERSPGKSHDEKMVDDGRWDEELTDQQMIFPRQTEVVCFPNAQWEKTKKREDLRRSISYWKHSTIAHFWTTSIPTLKSLKLHLARDTNLLCKVAQSWLACSLLHSLKNEKAGPCQGLEEVWLTETENEVEICLCASLRVKTKRHI